MHCLRWAAWCPFLEASDPGEEPEEETQIPLLGGPRPNPFGVVAYRATPASLTPSLGSATASAESQVVVETTMMAVLLELWRCLFCLREIILIKCSVSLLFLMMLSSNLMCFSVNVLCNSYGDNTYVYVTLGSVYCHMS